MNRSGTTKVGAFSMHQEDIDLIKKLAEELHVSKSAVVRRAINLLAIQNNILLKRGKGWDRDSQEVERDQAPGHTPG